ncbi:MAG: hypothetical protein DRJ02_03965 [Bacteroidetes bacterium]|nr:MAG: hypothetical protein DRI87_02020 [Bacteroidota bacterium]RLD88406.1 MAG: hypothetical protein DRJ02_03965 [Bacteroidota bacterium]
MSYAITYLQQNSMENPPTLSKQASVTLVFVRPSMFLFWEKISLFSYLSFGNSYHTMAKDTTVTKQSLLNLVMYQKQ